MDLIATTSLARSERAELMTIAQSFVGSPDFYSALKWSALFFLVYTVLIITLKIIFHIQNKKRSRMYGTVKRRR